MPRNAIEKLISQEVRRQRQGLVMIASAMRALDAFDGGAQVRFRLFSGGVRPEGSSQRRGQSFILGARHGWFHAFVPSFERFEPGLFGAGLRFHPSGALVCSVPFDPNLLRAGSSLAVLFGANLLGPDPFCPDLLGPVVLGSNPFGPHLLPAFGEPFRSDFRWFGLPSGLGRFVGRRFFDSPLATNSLCNCRAFHSLGSWAWPA